MNKFLNLAKALKVEKPFNEKMIRNVEHYILYAEHETDRIEDSLDFAAYSGQLEETDIDSDKIRDIRWYIEEAKELMSYWHDTKCDEFGFTAALREDLYNIHEGLSEFKKA